jgi:hypothetical protein
MQEDSMHRRQINELELQDLFATIGRGIWYLLYVEEALNTFITLKHGIGTPCAVSAAEGEAILEKHRRNTLGKSLKLSRDAPVLSSSLQARAEGFRDERNWLVHYLHRHREDLYIDEGRAKLMMRLESFVEEAMALQKLIAEETVAFTESKGLSREALLRLALDQIRRSKGESP